MLTKQVEIGQRKYLTVSIHGNMNNPKIMLLNGSIFNFNQFHYVYLPYLKKFTKGKYCIIQYDYVGYGYSSLLQGQFDFVTIADEHVELMDALNIPQAHLFGLSKGSIIAQLVTAKYPERVISLAGYGNPNLANDEGSEMAKSDYSKRLENVEKLQDRYKERITQKNFEEVYNTVYLPSLFGKSIDQLSIIDKLQSWWIKRKLKPIIIGPQIEILAKLFRYYLRDVLEDERKRYEVAIRGIQVPTLLLHGDADDTVPLSSSKLLHQWIENAELHVFKNFSHSKPTLVKGQGSKIMRRYADFLRDLE